MAVINETRDRILSNLKKRAARAEKDSPNSAGGFKSGLRSAIATVSATRVADEATTTAAIEAALVAERTALTEALKAHLGKRYKSGTHSLHDAEAEENRHKGYEDGIDEAINLIGNR
jgi:Arc/MetJ family transcription regulator